MRSLLVVARITGLAGSALTLYLATKSPATQAGWLVLAGLLGMAGVALYKQNWIKYTVGLLVMGGMVATAAVVYADNPEAKINSLSWLAYPLFLAAGLFWTDLLIHSNPENSLAKSKENLRLAAQIIGLSVGLMSLGPGLVFTFYGFNEIGRSGGWSILSALYFGAPLLLNGLLILAGGLLAFRKPGYSALLQLTGGLLTLSQLAFVYTLYYSLLTGISGLIGGLLVLSTLEIWRGIHHHSGFNPA